MQDDFNISTGALESLAFRKANEERKARKARENDFLFEICKEGGPMEVALKFLEGKQKIAPPVSY